MLPSQLGSPNEPVFVSEDVLDLHQRGGLEPGERLGLEVSRGQTCFVVPLLNGRVPDRLQAFVTAGQKLFVLS